MKISLKVLLICSLTLPGAMVFAEDKCEVASQEPAQFKALYQQSVSLGKSICQRFGQTIESTELLVAYEQFASDALEAVNKEFAGKSFQSQLVLQMKHFVSQTKKGVDKNRLPSFDLQEDLKDLDSTKIKFSFTDWDTKGVADLAAKECHVAGQPTCKELFESLKLAINPYKEAYASLSAADFTKKVTLLKNEWEGYFEEARSQTLWDAMITTKLEEDYLTQDYLVGPMQRQWFVVHPSIVVQNVSDALDGSQMKEAIAIEWFGVNWWNKETSPIGYPLGVSLASVYSDRLGIDDAGHGVMLTFDNRFSVGWADHGESNSIYVTVDLLNLLAEKKSRWDDYQDQIQELDFKQ